MKKYSNIFLKSMYSVAVLFSFLIYSADHHCVAITIPKCGTHLLLKTLALIKGMPNAHNSLWGDHVLINKQKFNTSFLSQKKVLLCKAHIIYHEQNTSLLSDDNLVKSFFIYRDPRDHVVSSAFWVKRRPADWPALKQLSIEELITMVIYDSGTIWGTIFPYKDIWQKIDTFESFYKLFLPWLNEPYVYTTSFEKLVGPKGGGSLEDQLKEIIAMARHMGLDFTLEQAQYVSDNLFGGSFSFREGKIGSWKKHFTSEHKEAFKKVAGQLLIDLGYEKDSNW